MAAFHLHPTVRIAGLFVAGLLLPYLRMKAAAWLFAALLALVLVSGQLRRLWRGLRALRWLLLALMLVYLAFTPGTPLLPQLPGFTREGAVDGAHRILILLNMVATVAVVLGPISPAALPAALLQLLHPLRGWRVVQRLAMRLGLCWSVAQTLLARPRTGSVAAQPLQVLVALCREVESDVGHTATDNVTELPQLPAPPLRDWVLAASIAGALAVFGT